MASIVCSCEFLDDTKKIDCIYSKFQRFMTARGQVIPHKDCFESFKDFKFEIPKTNNIIEEITETLIVWRFYKTILSTHPFLTHRLPVCEYNTLSQFY